MLHIRDYINLAGSVYNEISYGFNRNVAHLAKCRNLTRPTFLLARSRPRGNGRGPGAASAFEKELERLKLLDGSEISPRTAVWDVKQNPSK